MPALGPTARPYLPGSTAPEPVSCAGPSLRRMRTGLGTWVVIEAQGPGTATALAGAFGAIRDVEERLHPEHGGSDLARLRQAAPGETVPIHEDTFRVLEFAQRLFALSHRVFDPCL